MTGIGTFVYNVANIFIYLIIFRAVLSWFSPNPYNPLFQLLRRLTDPILEPIHRIMSRFLTLPGIDISPIVAILLLSFIRNFFVRF
jgi:YggT family protein